MILKDGKLTIKLWTTTAQLVVLMFLSFPISLKEYFSFYIFSTMHKMFDVLWKSVTISSVEFWRYYVQSTDEAVQIAGDFAIRMVGCGVTECGVERVQLACL
jgi:hypothetical protein